jgi:hypothetical protein
MFAETWSSIGAVEAPQLSTYHSDITAVTEPPVPESDSGAAPASDPAPSPAPLPTADPGEPASNW